MRQRRNHRLRRVLRRRADDPPSDRPDDEGGSGLVLFGGPRDGLFAKYERLLKKYEGLVHKYETSSVEETGVYQLGWWALRTSASALALVRDGGLCLTNHRWQELERGDGEPGWELVAPGEPPRTYPTLRQVAIAAAAGTAGDGAASHLARYRRRCGEQVIEVRTERIASKQGIVALLAHDVTAQVHAELELHKAREALHQRHRLEAVGEVASGVAHDLNNALNVMRLRLDLLGRELPESSHSAHLPALTRIVRDAAKRVARVHDLSHRETEERLELVELPVVIAEALALARTELEQHALVDGKSYRLVSDVPQMPPVRANAAELKHVFVNLLLNARDAMPGGGRIAIEGRREQDFAVVTVADEGTGIADEHLERVFDAFFTTKGGGTGLGLSMARGTMARLGGSIFARNRRPAGVELVLRFPLALHDQPAAETRAPERSDVAPRSLRVLLVDDDVDCLEVTQEVLEAEGVGADVAHSGAEALRMLREGSYDLLLCDVGMPEMSGWQVAQEARLHWPRMPIYMITGWGKDFLSEGSRPSDVDGVLGKPLDLGELRSVLAATSAPRV
jgi:signal transduction histidine kinase/CheY-like chemotaxis protein